MSFTIVAAVTQNYLDVLRYCLPSWYRNSGANKIIVENRQALPGRRDTAWYDNTAARCQAHRRNILACLDRGERVLAMDIDCVVLRDLCGGFSDGHAISVARWPNINMGVMFFQMVPGVPLASMIHRVTGRIVDNCRKYRGQLRPGGGCWLADQMVWEAELRDFDGYTKARGLGSRIHKLDANEWNFCPLPGVWEGEFLKHKDTMRICHLKGQGQPHRHELPKRLLREHFDGLL